MNNQPKVAIIGFGRFGQVLQRLFAGNFDLTVYQRHPIHRSMLDKNTKVAATIASIYESDVIFFAVPISSLAKIVAAHKKYFQPRHLLIDVLSVKAHAKQVFTKELKNSKTRALLTHPMFGPDSSKDGFEGLPIIMNRLSANKKEYEYWKAFFTKQKLRIVEMSAEEHDRLAAESQGLTHFIGRLLKRQNIQPTQIDSSGAKKLLEIEQLTCNDTWQLFHDLQHYNPYTANMRLKLGENLDWLYGQLLPKHVKKGVLTIGIQGGVGSFNEKASLAFLQKHNIVNYEIKYLYTTSKVLRALHKGSIDYGQFAIHNSVGGIVQESIQAMSKYKFRIIEQFAIPITHALMIHKDAEIEEVDSIMTHDQVLAQCKNSLVTKYPHLKQVTGKGDLIDHALVAKHLSEGKIGKNIATIGSDTLANIYDLQIIEKNLQDSTNNLTSFLMVTRN